MAKHYQKATTAERAKGLHKDQGTLKYAAEKAAKREERKAGFIRYWFGDRSFVDIGYAVKSKPPVRIPLDLSKIL